MYENPAAKLEKLPMERFNSCRYPKLAKSLLSIPEESFIFQLHIMVFVYSI